VQTPQVLTVRAPFNVVDGGGHPVVAVTADGSGRGLDVFSSSGQRVVEVGDWINSGILGVGVRSRAGVDIALLGEHRGDAKNGVVIYNEAGVGVAGVSTSASGDGMVYATDVSRTDQLQMKVTGTQSGFYFYTAGIKRAFLGRHEKGNTALSITAGGDVNVAALGESAGGEGGALRLRSPDGSSEVRGGIAPGEGGQVLVIGAGGGQAGIATKGSVGSAFAGPPEEPVALMGESEVTAGAGHLMLAAPGGASAVQAGYQGNTGLVVTYAQGKPAGILSPGLKIPGFTAGANW
jgi:hypothetical protein